MPTPWHNAFVATMAGTDAWIGVTSESPIGKHFVWSNGMPLKYVNWRDLHPTHQDIVGADTREGVKMIKWYSSGDPSSHLPSLTPAHPGQWEDVGPMNTMHYI